MEFSDGVFLAVASYVEVVIQQRFDLLLDQSLVFFGNAQELMTISIPNVADGTHELVAHFANASLGCDDARVTFQTAVDPSRWLNEFGRKELLIVEPHNGAFLSSGHALIALTSVNVDLALLMISVNGTVVSFARNSSLQFSIPPLPDGENLIVVSADGATASVLVLVDSSPRQAQKAVVTLCVLTSSGPTTLNNSLSSYRAAGLLTPLVELLVFVQRLDPTLTAVAEAAGARVVGLSRAIGKGNAWLFLAHAARSDIILFLEEDFACVQPPPSAEVVLFQAVDALLSRASDAVRLRHRKAPGEPLWAERSFISSGGRLDFSHLLHAVHFVSFPHIRFARWIRRCGPLESLFCTASKFADYTNNPVAYRRADVVGRLRRLFAEDDFNTMERRIAAAWSALDLTVAQGTGLFNHARADRSDGDSAPLDEPTAPPPFVRSKVRVAFLNHGLGVGGVERQIAMIASRLDRARFEVEIVLFSFEGPWAEKMRAIGVPTRLFEVFDSECNGGATLADSQGAPRDHFQERVDALVAHLSTFDVVHTWYGGGPLNTRYTFSSQVCHRAGVRVILNLAWHVPAVDPLVDAVVIEYPAAALLHNPLQRLFRHGLGAHVPALLPIPAGVDIDALKRSRTIVADGSTVVVGRISRLVAEKDPETFIAAAAVLLRRFETGRVRFVIYGDGDADAASRALAEELGLHPPHFEFRGHTEDVRGALEEMDVFAYSTSGDTAAFVVLEAMAMSLPIVSTKIDGVTALVDDGVNGFSVEQKDVLAFADAVDRLVRDGSLRQAMGAASRRMAEGKHDLKTSVALYAEAYAEVAQTRYVRVTGPFGK